MTPSMLRGRRFLTLGVTAALVVGSVATGATPAPAATPVPAATPAPVATPAAATTPTPTPAAGAAARWSIVPSPSPPGPPNGDMTSVACANPANCFAVGFGDTPNGTQIEQWNGTSWSIVPSASTPNGEAELVGVACPSPTACFAVGDIGIGSVGGFRVTPLVERWNGTKWSVVAAPSPSGIHIAELSAVSCSSPTSCFAVGDTSGGGSVLDVHALVERWNGTRWSVVASAVPTGSRAEILLGVSCVNGSSCLAVGAYLAGSRTRPLAERWNGSRWSVVPSVVPAGQDGAGLSSVSCTSPTDCVAVGSSFTESSTPPFESDTSPLAEHWNGTSWTVVPTPSPAGVSGALLDAVSCASPTDCSAVGGTFTVSSSSPIDGELAPLNEHWDGTSWTIVAGPVNAPYTALVGVACPSATTCFAVGDSGLVEQWDGTSWSIAPFGAQSSQSGLSGVSCPSATSCFAVGSYQSGARFEPLVEHWDGARWSIVAAPSASGARNSALIDVSCARPTDCTAVGLYQRADSKNVTLIEHWNGSTWSVVPSPNPGGVLLAQLTDVSCATPKRCDAIGAALKESTIAVFGEHWDGTRWSVVAVPTPVFAEFVQLTGLSCPSATSCFAVGGYQAVTGLRKLVAKTLIEHWDGRRWKTVPSPEPGAAAFAALGAVSCSSTSHCLAVGISAATDGSFGGALTERWDGAHWTVVPGASPIQVLGLTALSCRSRVSCYGVGSTFSATGGTTLVAHWNGRSWTVVPSPKPSRATDAGLAGIACPTRTSCTAVGRSVNVYGSFTLAVRGT